MACGCTKRAKPGTTFIWTSDPDPVTGEMRTEERRTEVEVRALVIQHGGTWDVK